MPTCNKGHCFVAPYIWLEHSRAHEMLCLDRQQCVLQRWCTQRVLGSDAPEDTPAMRAHDRSSRRSSI